MTGTTGAHTEECRRRLENCSTEDKETKFRSEAAKLREGWLASRVESTEKSRGGDAVSQQVAQRPLFHQAVRQQLEEAGDQGDANDEGMNALGAV